MKFCLIIPVFNPPPELANHLGQLEESCPGALAVLILVDDGSTNGVVETARERFPDLTVVRGSGDLWWAGGMRVGMERALETDAEVVIWLNHDCLPDPGTLAGIADLAAADGVGAVSAWCYCREDANYGVNPGFRDWEEIPVAELEEGGMVEVDGVNGNCTAISMKAIRRVGLPRSDRHRHYGDGPYTWRLRRAGFRNYVDPAFRAALEREFERCISEKEHSEFWNVRLVEKLQYYLFSNRSKFHWKYRFFDLVIFHGPIRGALRYPLVIAGLVLAVSRGHMKRSEPAEKRIEEVVTRYRDRFPPECLRRDLVNLVKRAAS